MESTSYMDLLNNYYNTYLMDYDSFISSAKYCSENEKNDNKTYNTYQRVYTNKIPTLNCLGSTINSKIGLLTVDEVIYSGLVFNNDNLKSFLYNKDITSSWWTSSLATFSDNDFNPFIVNDKGRINNNISGLTYESLRPVVNLNRKVIVSSGNGTINNPYTLEM